jgi:hypothetical protein
MTIEAISDRSSTAFLSSGDGFFAVKELRSRIRILWRFSLSRDEHIAINGS